MANNFVPYADLPLKTYVSETLYLTAPNGIAQGIEPSVKVTLPEGTGRHYSPRFTPKFPAQFIAGSIAAVFCRPRLVVWRRSSGDHIAPMREDLKARYGTLPKGWNDDGTRSSRTFTPTGLALPVRYGVVRSPSPKNAIRVGV